MKVFKSEKRFSVVKQYVTVSWFNNSEDELEARRAISHYWREGYEMIVESPGDAPDTHEAFLMRKREEEIKT